MPDPAAAPAAAPVPYLGLRPFAEEEAPLFFGREREKVELTRLVESDAVSILYGVSGVGKSSLLNAGLFPRLRQRAFLPVRLRLDHDEAAPPLGLQLQRAVHAAAAQAGVALPEPRGDETLWEFFHRRERAEFWTDDHRLLTPLLALDQFEEFFSLGHERAARRARSEDFRAQFLALMENTPPAHAADAALDPRAFDFASSATPRFLLILREDFIAQLLPIVDALAERLPSIHRQKLRLLPLDAEEAREVIAGPARALGLEPPDDEAAAAIARLAAAPAGDHDESDGNDGSAPAGGVEPARLALLLAALESERQSRGLPRISADLAALAGADLFARFVDQALDGQPDAARVFLEEELVTPAGYRSDATADQAARFGVEETVLRHLQERRLLAVRPGWPVRYELSHDLLCPPIRKSRDERQAREGERRAREAAAAAQARVRRAWRVALVAGAVAVVALGALAFALYEERAAKAAERAAKAAEAEIARQKTRAEAGEKDAQRNAESARATEAEANKQKTRAEAGEKDALAAKERAVSSKKAADELISFMQYDLRDKLGKLGALDMMDDINARIRRYQEEHPPEAGDEAAQDDADRERAVALDQQGHILLARGELAAALKSYQDGMAIANKLAAKNPANTDWQRDLSVSFEKVGEVLQAQGDLPAALKSYQESMAIAKKLAAKDPANADWQRDLSVNFNNVGDVQKAQGDLSAALQSDQQSLAILQKLVAKDPANTDWQRDLSVSFEKVGEVLQAQGDLPAALKSYQESMAIAKKLAAKDPANADWQRDLSVNFNNVGDVQKAQGDLSAALQNYRQSLAIAEKLAAKDPANTDWQRNLSISFDNVGDVQKAQGDLSAALQNYQQSLAIAETLAAKDPTNSDWQLDLAYSERNVGLIFIRQKQMELARPRSERYRQIVDRLANEHPGNYFVQTDRAYARWMLAHCADKRTSAGRNEARRLLREAADILHGLEKSPSLQPTEADWLRAIESELSELKK